MTYQYVFHLPEHYELRGFEEELAYLELSTLIGSDVLRKNDCFTVARKAPVDPASLLRLAFIEKVEIHNGTTQTIIEPYQVDVDRTASSDNDVFLSGTPTLVKQLQVTRRTHNYLTHSLHSYKGKFYPQIAKSLINFAGVEPGGVVFDPFSGSGTTMVECLLNGFRGMGTDLNPLAVLIGKVKVELLLVEPKELRTSIDELLHNIQQRFLAVGLQDEGIDDLLWAHRGQHEENIDYKFKESEDSTWEYLETWFESVALAKLSLILEEINQITNPRIRNYAKVILSDNIRDYSLQVPGQLRVRRRKTSPDHSDLLLSYRQNLYKYIQVPALSKAIGLQKQNDLPDIQILEADVRHLDQASISLLSEDGQIDAIVTSPPYATALPYIDTDRLSLFLLGLLEKDERGDLEWRMIGNREITTTARRGLEEEFLSSYESNPLPMSVKRFIREILERNAEADVGFRRKNKASLLYKYFEDMRQAFIQFHRVLKPGAYCAVVIGNSKTKAGGEWMEIRTDDFLIDIGESVGFKLVKSFPMTDQAAYMIHSKNVIEKETIFILEKLP